MRLRVLPNKRIKLTRQSVAASPSPPHGADALAAYPRCVR